MKTYQGTRDEDGRVHVTVTTATGSPYPLKPRHDLYNHSPDGFEWGYSGSGPAQLALAILAEHLRGEEDGDRTALDNHQAFKFKVVAGLPRRGWVLSSDEITKALLALSEQ